MPTTAYHFYWSTTSPVVKGPQQYLNMTSPFVLTGLTNGTTYYYLRESVTQAGVVTDSPEVSATPFAGPAPTFTVTINMTAGIISFPNKYPGWSVGGGSATNFIALPPGWTAGGGSATNFVGLAPGWTAGGGSATNYVALPPGWSVGGGSATNYVAVAPGWVVGGGSATNYVTYPGPSVTTIQIAFNDPGFLAMFQVLKTSGLYSDSTLADMIMAVQLNIQSFHLLRTGPWTGTAPRELAPAGQW